MAGELKSETESKGRVLSQWNGFGKAEKEVGRREIIFDSWFGYLPTTLRIFLVDRDGKNPATFEIKTSWEKYGTDQWRQSQIVVSGPQGNDWVEDTFDFAWAATEELKAFLATKDWNEFLKNDNSDWYKTFSGFVGSQQANKEKPKAK